MIKQGMDSSSMRRSRTPPTKRELAETFPNSDVMNALEAASFLGIHVETLRKLARRNEIPSFKIGRDWRFRKEALLSWAEEQRPIHGRASGSLVGNGIEGSPVHPRQGRRGLSIADSLDAVRRHMATRGDHVGATGSDDEDRDLAVKILSLVSAPDNLRGLIQTVTLCLQKWLGCDAVGVRLRQGLDFPYYETRGFSDEFVLAERYLCTRDSMNELLRDSDGNPVIECMCGNIICGRFDPSKPFFTERGSFWTNSTTQLLASTTEKDRQARTRNRCNGEGYESVALFPLKSEIEILGLLQINDKRKGLFNDEIIALLERLAESLTFTVSQKQAQTQPEAVAVNGSFLDGRNGLILSGLSRLPANASPPGSNGILSLEVALDSANHRIVKVACDVLPKLGREMLSGLLMNRILPGALQEAKERITEGYHSELRNAVVAALEDVLRNYRKLFEGVGSADMGKLGSVLIIDDDAKVCRAMCRLVKRIGCRARYVLDGAEGLEQVFREAPDLIMLDLKMPGMNGPEFLKELRKTQPDLPVVIVTGYPDSDLMEQATQYAPIMLLSKTAETSQIESTVRMAIGERMAVR